MNNLVLDLSFYNSESDSYIGFDVDDDGTEFGFNMESLLDLGLGQIEYKDDPFEKGPFRKFLQTFVTDIAVVKQMLTIPTKNNYKKQLTNISKNPSRYFGENLKSLPQEILDELK
ncbi:MAG: hypothetical protein O7C56_00575 [Rickettsia endosymbiont of Ixodes persulcatus]|nr:hypothetical protein [Rickettsia endosymbiont of Ixodes persulcatus]